MQIVSVFYFMIFILSPQKLRPVVHRFLKIKESPPNYRYQKGNKNLTIIWHFLVGICEQIQIFVYKEKLLKILCTIIQNLFATMTRHMAFVHSWLTLWFLN